MRATYDCNKTVTRSSISLTFDRAGLPTTVVATLHRHVRENSRLGTYRGTYRRTSPALRQLWDLLNTHPFQTNISCRPEIVFRGITPNLPNSHASSVQHLPSHCQRREPRQATGKLRLHHLPTHWLDDLLVLGGACHTSTFLRRKQTYTLVAVSARVER